MRLGGSVSRAFRDGQEIRSNWEAPGGTTWNWLVGSGADRGASKRQGDAGDDQGGADDHVKGQGLVHDIVYFRVSLQCYGADRGSNYGVDQAGLQPGQHIRQGQWNRGDIGTAKNCLADVMVGWQPYFLATHIVY